MNRSAKKKGFTLTELIVVIVIIGILAAILIPTLTGYIKKAKYSNDVQKTDTLNVYLQNNSLLYDYEINNRQDVIDLLGEHLEENQDQFYVDDVLDVVKFVDYKLDQLFNYKNRITYTIVFNLERENTESEWVLKDLSEADLKKIHGIYSN